MDAQVKRQWARLTKGRKAWELAKVALGEGASVDTLIKRANEIKECLRYDYQPCNSELA